jgi:hypothetical protein
LVHTPPRHRRGDLRLRELSGRRALAARRAGPGQRHDLAGRAAGSAGGRLKS